MRAPPLSLPNVRISRSSGLGLSFCAAGHVAIFASANASASIHAPSVPFSILPAMSCAVPMMAPFSDLLRM